MRRRARRCFAVITRYHLLSNCHQPPVSDCLVGGITQQGVSHETHASCGHGGCRVGRWRCRRRRARDASGHVRPARPRFPHHDGKPDEHRHSRQLIRTVHQLVREHREPGDQLLRGRPSQRAELPRNRRRLELQPDQRLLAGLDQWRLYRQRARKHRLQQRVHADLRPGAGQCGSGDCPFRRMQRSIEL
jgi:hypothetical protein